MSRRLTWQKSCRCVNCKEPIRSRKCLLCSDCWRVAIVAPCVIFVVESVLKWGWDLIVK